MGSSGNTELSVLSTQRYYRSQRRRQLQHRREGDGEQRYVATPRELRTTRHQVNVLNFPRFCELVPLGETFERAVVHLLMSAS